VPASGTRQSEQHAHQRRLSCAVRAEESVQLTRLSDEVHAAKCFAISVALRNADGLDGGPLDHGRGW
jgi:HKD family nuclease